MEYYKHEKGVSQYADLEDQTVVRARYIEPALSTDRGNPYIEALPPSRNVNDLEGAYTRFYPGYRYADVKNMTAEEKMDQADMLQMIRFPLIFHEDLERFLRSVMLSSYRARNRRISETGNVIYVSEDREQLSDSTLRGDPSEGTNSGLAVTGYSGSGKTSTVHLALMHYPRLIIHEGSYGRFPQIPWLMVNCIPNSNFSALYRSIGAAIDDVLGNDTGCYEKQIIREISNGAKEAKVKEFIKKLAIGVLILDEIQLINFDSTKENSFEALLEITNQTKVGLVVIGTEEARAKMFSKVRMGRRVGYELRSDSYCEDKDYFRLIAKFVWHYQWFDKPVDLTDDIVDVLYDLSKGLVAQLINIYRCVAYDYISRDEKQKPVVSAAYIRKVAAKYLSGLQKVLTSVDFEDRIDETAVSKEAAEAFINEFRQKAATSHAAGTQEEVADRQVLLENIAAMIRPMFSEYSDDMIQDSFNRVIKRKSSKGKSDGEIARLVINELQKQPKRRVGKTKPAGMSHEQMMNFLNIYSEDAT